MGWKKGDLGRFHAEQKDRPRFELLGAYVTEDGTRMVRIWYGGETQPQHIAWTAFKRDYTNVWCTTVLNPHSLPKWLEPGVTFFLYPGGHHIIQAKISEPQPIDTKFRRRVGNHHVSVDTGSKALVIRQIQLDHTSCLMGDQLVMVPVDHIRKWGYRLPPTSWERIMEDDDDDLFESL